MGKDLDGIIVKDLDGGSTLDDDLAKFRISRTHCTVARDRHLLLAVIENTFGDHSTFDAFIQLIVQSRRGRLEANVKARRSSFSGESAATVAAKRRLSRSSTSSADNSLRDEVEV